MSEACEKTVVLPHARDEKERASQVFQQDTDDRMRIFANFIIDQILEDHKNKQLRFTQNKDNI